MTRILVIHGAGMGMRGKAQVNVFGPMKLSEYDDAIREFGAKQQVDVEFYYSNTEGQIIDRLFAAHDEGIAGAIINPDGFTKGYPALVAAIGRVGFPTIEVHISNPAARGTVSEIATACAGSITGFGIKGYALAIEGLKSMTSR